MVTVILIATVIFLLALACGVVIWFAFHARRSAQGKEPAPKNRRVESLPFRWNYIILPVVILLLSIILAVFFYPQLPTGVAYHFKLDGSPDKWLSQEMIMVWVLLPQLGLVLLAGAIVWGMTKLDILSRQTEANLKPERILSLMGNMIGLPQLVICFAMLDIFSYNSYGMHIMPIWIFALIVMGLGSIILGIFFILAIRRVWRVSQ
ncbi:hypothetical protein ES703_63824 [subsurface metagenome]